MAGKVVELSSDEDRAAVWKKPEKKSRDWSKAFGLDDDNSDKEEKQKSKSLSCSGSCRFTVLQHLH
jgi:hypothetical protein